MVIHVDEENFEEEILYSDIPVVDDLCTGCGACWAFCPVKAKKS